MRTLTLSAKCQVHEEIVRHGSHAVCAPKWSISPWHCPPRDDDNCAVRHLPRALFSKPVAQNWFQYISVSFCAVELVVQLLWKSVEVMSESITIREKIWGLNVIKIISFGWCRINVQSTMSSFWEKKVNYWISWRKKSSDSCLFPVIFPKKTRQTDRNAVLLHFSSSRNQF